MTNLKSILFPLFIVSICFVPLIVGCINEIKTYKDKLNEAEKALLICINNKGGAVVIGDEAFLCSSASIGKVNKKE